MATDLEIMERHLEEGDEVTAYQIPGRLHNPEYKVCARFPILRNFRYDRTLSHALARLRGRIQVRPLAPQPVARAWPALHVLSDLMAIRHGGFDVGMGVASSLVSFDGKTLFDPGSQQSLAHDMCAASGALYDAALAAMQKDRPDKVYFFNGRFFHARAIMRACEKLGIPFDAHERGCDRYHYALFPNCLPHDREWFQQDIRRAWENHAPDRVEVGTAFFVDSAGSKELAWHSFIGQQQDDLLPEGWDPAAENIVCFNSSEDEFVSIGPTWAHDYFPSQVETLRELAARLQSLRPQAVIWVRLHPRLKSFPEQAVPFESLAGTGIQVIPAASPVSSYALLRHCHKVLAFGSTMGVEAAFWGKHSILLWPSLYDQLGSVTKVDTMEALVQAVLEGHPLPPEGALMYGYYMKTYGLPYRYYVPADLGEGKYRGLRLGPGPLLEGLSRLAARLK